MSTDPGDNVPANGRTGRVTLEQVAEAAGVSRSAASLAVRGLPGVADSTRRRIATIADRLGYEVRRTSPSSDTRSIAVLVKSRPDDNGATNAFYGPVSAGILSACAPQQIDVRTEPLPVDQDSNPMSVPRVIQSSAADGFLVLGAYVSSATARLFEGRPVVLVDGYCEGEATIPSVVTDNEGGGHQAARRLIDQGHRHTAFVGSTPDSFPSILQRRQGYDRAISDAGLAPLHFDAPYEDPPLAAEAIAEQLSSNPQVTGLVASNDAVAINLMSHLADLGISVPDDVSIVGFDDIDAASMVRPRLDTVAVDKLAMGELSVSLLLHRMEHLHAPPFTATQATRLVERGSVSNVE